MQRERLSKTERKVMEKIWESNKELTQNEVRMKCNERFGTNWKRQTVNTFLRRIEAKGYLTSRPIKGKTSVFTPLNSKNECIRKELERISEECKVSKEYLKSLL